VTAELRAYSFETAVTDRRYSCFAEVSWRMLEFGAFDTLPDLRPGTFLKAQLYQNHHFP
jgi:hypothetical protein